MNRKNQIRQKSSGIKIEEIEKEFQDEILEKYQNASACEDGTRYKDLKKFDDLISGNPNEAIEQLVS